MQSITGFNPSTKERTLDVTSIGEAFKKGIVPYDQELKEIMSLLQSYQIHLDKEKLAKARTKAARKANNADVESIWHNLAEEVREWIERYNEDADLNQAARSWK